MKNSRVNFGFCAAALWCSVWIPSLLLLVEGQHRSPRITEHPKDVLVKKNEPTTLNCKAEGKPDPTIEWFKDGELQRPSNDGHRIFLPGGDLFFLSVSDGKKESDSGIYWCIARNSIGVVQSRNASLQVGVIRDEFRTLPQSTKVLAGETATLKCQPPRGTPDPQVLWYKSGQSIDTRLASSRLQSVDGGNLIIRDVRITDAGRYQCQAINIAGTRASPEVTLTVHQKPYFKTEPKDVIVLIGDSAVFNCDVDGTPTPSVDWYRQDAQMPKDRSERIGNSLKIKEARQEDEGLYFCQVQNIIGSVRASALLSVQSKPKFTIRPKNLVRVDLGETVKLDCAATGNPEPSIYWRKGGSQDVYVAGIKYMQDDNDDNHLLFVGTDGSLTIQKIREGDIGNYICSGINPAGSVEAIAKLELKSSQQRLPPIIGLGPTNQTLPIKSMVSFPCEVVGVPSPTVKWFKDGLDMGRDADNEQRITISPNGTLQINDLRANDSGLYTCVGSSSSGQQFGETSRTGALWVESPTNPNIAFKRTDPSLLPQAPSAPIANETTSTTITLSWTWTVPTKQVPFTRTQPLLGFTLESYSPDVPLGSWTTLGRRIYGGGSKTGEVFYTVEGLKPDAKYIFIVRAETQEGFSPVSNISKIIKTRGVFRGSDLEDFDEEEMRNQLATSDIQLISSEPTSSTSIRISWKVSKSVIKFIDGFYLRYREILSGSSSTSGTGSNNAPKGFKMLTVVAQKTDAYSHTISNLEKFTQYEVLVAPFYKSVEGLVSNSKMVITSEDKPSAPPQIQSSRMMNSSTVAVRWSPPPETHHNGILVGYRVEVRGNESRAEMSFGRNITSMVLSNLTLGSSYLIRIAAFTSVGGGPWSPPLTITMDPRSMDFNSLGISSGDGPTEILKEVWFIILMGFLLFIFLLLLVIILYTRRKSHGKKDHISSVAVAPHANSQYVSGKQTLWIDQRWRPNNDPTDKDSNRSDAKLLTNHLNNDMMTDVTEYAEVDPHNLTTFYGGPLMQQQPDLTPYATTTLIQQRRPAYDLLSVNGGGLYNGKYREGDQFSSGRSKFSTGSNNFKKYMSTQPSPSPSPLAPMKRVPMPSRLGCFPSPDASRSHLTPFEQSLQASYNTSVSSGRLPSNCRANENLYHIGEIFNPNKSALLANGFTEVVYQSGDPDFSNYHPQQSTQMCSLMDREIQSSLPSLASDSTSCNLYAECNEENIIINPSKNPMMIAKGSNTFNVNSNGGVARLSKNSRSTSPAYSSDSFTSGKSANKRLYKGSYNTGNGKPMDRRQLAPLFSS